MPDIPIRGGVLTVVGDFKPGDMPPGGYTDWHEWAEVQYKAGLRQKECGRCGKWKFPQELSNLIDRHAPKDRHGKTVQIATVVCLECAGKASQQ